MKPCPLCGSALKFTHPDEFDGDVTAYASVRCSCGFRFEVSERDFNEGSVGDSGWECQFKNRAAAANKVMRLFDIQPVTKTTTVVVGYR